MAKLHANRCYKAGICYCKTHWDGAIAFWQQELSSKAEFLWRFSSIIYAIVFPVDDSDYQWQNTFPWICGIFPERLNHLSSVLGQQYRKHNNALLLGLNG